jgi:hypothetical protein
LIVDDLAKDLMGMVVDSWMMFSLYEARVKAKKMLEHTAKWHPKPARIEAHEKQHLTGQKSRFTLQAGAH